jgi:Ser/Thr protein kinase RdoA (MazF antagonist)
MTDTSTHTEHRDFDQMCDAVEHCYGFRVKELHMLEGGEESKNFLVGTPNGDRVLRLGPRWRTSAELEWSYALAAHAATQTDKVLTPYPALNGTLVTRSAGRPLSVWPFVDGRAPNLEDAADLDLAAEVLARLHCCLSSWPGPFARPATSPHAPIMRRIQNEPEYLRDLDLDHWLGEWRRSRARLVAPIHGDYWCNNLVYTGSGAARVIDWDDARIGSVDRELAWAVWEFCADPANNSLNSSRASRFLDVYAARGGPVQVADRSFVTPLIRQHLRFEIRLALAAKERGDRYSLEYMEAEMRAFSKLRLQLL